MKSKVRCVICGKSSDTGTSWNFKSGNQLALFEIDIFTSWKKECAAATCQVLFDNQSDYFVNYFQNSNYCSRCRQIVRDLGFNWKQMQSFQQQVFQLSRKIINLLDSNYKQIEGKSEAKVVQDKVSSFLLQDESSKFAFEEMVEIIYTVISNHHSRETDSSGSKSAIGNRQKYKDFGIASTIKIPIQHHESSDNIDIKMEQDSDAENCLEYSTVGSREQHSRKSFPALSESFLSTKKEQFHSEFTSQSAKREPTVTVSSNNVAIKNEDENTNNLESNWPDESLFSYDVENVKVENTETVDEYENSESGNSDWIGDNDSENSFSSSTSVKRVSTRNVTNNKRKQTSSEFSRKKSSVKKAKESGLNESKFLNCSYCQRECGNQRALTKHINSVHKKKTDSYPFPCSFCGKKYLTEEKRTLHYSNAHQEPNPFQCAFCPALYTNREDLTQHTEEYHQRADQVPEVICNICGKCYVSRAGLSYHRRTQHKNKQELDDLEDNPNENSATSTLSADEEIKNEKDFHVQSSKKIISEVETSVSDCIREPLRCTEENCNFFFPNEEKLQRHIYLTHKVKKAFKCKQCPASYTLKINLRGHIRRVHEQADNPCSFCGKLYESKEDLTLHYSNSHQEPNPFQCAFCTQIYQNGEDLIKHTQLLHPTVVKDERKLLGCPRCEKKFTNPKSLKKHVSCVHEKKRIVYNFECTFCGRKYATADELTLHYSNSHQQPNPFQCAFCPELYTNHKSLVKHTKAVHPDPRKVPKFKCAYCDKRYPSFSGLKNHRLQKHNDQKNANFHCSLCDQKFTLEHYFHLHLEKHNGSDNQCDKCGKPFETSKQLNRHMNLCQKAGEYKCELCGVTVKTKYGFDRHMTMSHYNKMVKKFEVKPVVHECKFCGKDYKDETELNLHYSAAHQGPNPFTCAFCPEIFSNSLDLQNHTKSAHCEIKKGLFPCESCDRSFNCKRSFKRHSLLHGDPKLLIKCGTCYVVFPDQESLSKHSVIHAEMTNLICETCGKSFKNILHLRTHLKIHDESAKKVKCTLCDKRFYSKSKLKHHEKTHTDIKEFICQVCGKGFHKKWNFTEHSRVHTGEGYHKRKRKPKS